MTLTTRRYDNTGCPCLARGPGSAYILFCRPDDMGVPLLLCHITGTLLLIIFFFVYSLLLFPFYMLFRTTLSP